MSEKGKSILAYVFTWLGGLIVLYGMKDNQRNTKIHAAQAIVIGLGYTAINIIYSIISAILWRTSYTTIPFGSTIIYGLYIVLIVIGIIKANKEENPELPVVGGLAMSWFGKKINEENPQGNFDPMTGQPINNNIQPQQPVQPVQPEPVQPVQPQQPAQQNNNSEEL